MTVFTGKQVFPVDYEPEVSQRLLEASYAGDLKSVEECLASDNAFVVDVNYVGAVWLKVRTTEIVLRDECACEVRVEYEEFKTDVTALFLAVHAGNVALVKLLLSYGADVNQKLFRGFATTAAAREGHLEILEILLKAGASQPACEEALLEASCHGRAKLAELLMGSDLIRAPVAVHALVTSCCRGFLDVVDTLLKCGANVNATDRMLLRSSMPALHTNVDCTALVAAVVSRQVSIVRLLLQMGARSDVKVTLGAWSWDMATGEEFRVGAGLAEPYAITWCAVEYFEASGTILRMLLQHQSSNTPHHGRTLLHHAILCRNSGAVSVLLNSGANVELPIKTTKNTEFRAIHMATRLGLSTILQRLIDSGCDKNSRTDSAETPLMICAKTKRDECVKILAMAGADFGLLDPSGQSAITIALSNRWSLGFQQALLRVIRAGKVPQSSNLSVFSPLLFVAQTGDVQAMNALIQWPEINIDYQNENGFSAVMLTALEGHVEAFRLLVYAGANVKLCTNTGETAISLSELNQNCTEFEKVMLEYALEKGNQNTGGFYALHCASRRGDIDAVMLLTSRGYDVNVPDGDGYTPLMLAAREGLGAICKLLISNGAYCETKTNRGETALLLARKRGGKDNEAEQVIFNELARKLVIKGTQVKKHTKGGKGSPHQKEIKMVAAAGMLRWGKSSRRNVICLDAEVGPSLNFQINRLNKSDSNEPGLFRVITNKNKEVHFVCEGGVESAELWVRGIKLLTESVFGN